MAPKIYYVYQYFDPIRKEPIYIGMGKNQRYLAHLKSKYKHPFIQRLQWIQNQGKEPIITKLYENLTELEALKLEKYIESLIGRKNINKGPLLNLKPCGRKGGVSIGNKNAFGNQNRLNIPHTQKTKNKIRKKLIGTKQSKHTIKIKTDRISRKWLITFPDKHQEIIKNLSQFCKNQKLKSYTGLSAYGKYKGYVCQKINDPL